MILYKIIGLPFGSPTPLCYVPQITCTYLLLFNSLSNSSQALPDLKKIRTSVIIIKSTHALKTCGYSTNLSTKRKNPMKLDTTVIVHIIIRNLRNCIFTARFSDCVFFSVNYLTSMSLRVTALLLYWFSLSLGVSSLEVSSLEVPSF